MNNDGANKCIEIAQEAMQIKDYEKAIKFLNKSLKMSYTEKAKKLLEECEQKILENSDSPDSSPKQNYTDEDVKIANEICSKKNYYEILNVPKNANEEDIKKSYKKLALKLHPDKNHAPQATEAFKKLSQACSVLTDKNKRIIYDQNGSEETQSRPQARHNFSHMETEIDPEDLFDLLFTGSINPNRRRRRQRHAENIYVYRQNAPHENLFHYQNVNQTRQQNQRTNFAKIFSAFPIILVILFALLFHMKNLLPFGKNAEYSFTPNSQFHYYRVSQKANLRYYVDDDFEFKYGKNITTILKFEEKVENDYLENLWRQCSYAKYIKSNLEERKFYARKQEKEKIENEIRNLDMSSCENYVKIKKIITK